MAKYNVGDKIHIIKATIGCYGANGKTGIVTNKTSNNGLLQHEDGFNVLISDTTQIWRIGYESKCELIKKAQNETIVIYHNGNETIALDKTTGRRTVAKCAPDDTYDFMTGAKLAFERLTGDDVKEVRRRAKIGEYVKIVDAGKGTDVPVKNDGTPCYKNGDIMKIIAINRGFARFDNGRDKNNMNYILFEGEYVVLENYRPQEKKLEEPKLYNGKVVCVASDIDDEENFHVGMIYNVTNGRIMGFPLYGPLHDFADLEDYFSSANTRKRKPGNGYTDKTIKFVELVED